MRARIMKGALASFLVACVLAISTGAASAASKPEFQPNDPAFANSPSYTQVDLPSAWYATRGSPTVTIAVVDGGATQLPDLAPPRLLPGYNAFDGTGNVSDEFGHGIGMSSIIAAGIDDGLGVPGVCPQCSVLPVKVTLNNQFTEDVLARGINWATARRPQIMNLSLIGGPDSTVDAAVTAAIKSGVTVVIAAGNSDSPDPGANRLASDNPQAIRVAGVDANNQLNGISNYGASWVDIATPACMPSENAQGFVGGGCGTSATAAVVSGVSGLLKSFNPSLTSTQIKSILMSSGTKVPGLPVACGCVLNVYQALIAAGYMAPKQLAINLTGDGGGTVQDTSSNIDCEDQCAEWVPVGSQRTLTAKPDQWSVFTGWSGNGCSGTDPVCTVTANGDISVTATFARKLLRLTVRKQGLGTVTGTGIVCGKRCSTKLAAGTDVALKAKAKAGWKFAGWSGACHGRKPVCPLTLKTATAVKARFKKK